MGLCPFYIEQKSNNKKHNIHTLNKACLFSKNFKLKFLITFYSLDVKFVKHFT